MKQIWLYNLAALTMNRRIISALALVLVGLMIGIIVSRLFPVQPPLFGDVGSRPELALTVDWVALGAAFLLGIAVGALLILLRGGAAATRTVRPAPEPVAEFVAPGEAPALALAGAAVAANAEPETILGNARFNVVRQANRYTAEAHDIGKYESVRFSVVLPRAWWGRPEAQTAKPVTAQTVLKSLARADTFAWVLFGLSLLLYGFTRLYKLDEFPISFLGDEAIVGTLARDLLQNGFHDPKRGWFPLYFDFFFVVNPLISVYTEALAISFFGLSITVVRATTALVTVFGVAAAALTLKSFFNLRYWWAAVLFLAITPTWFLHSRTGFDTVTATAFYAIFIFCYCVYRYKTPKFSFVLVLAGGAMFYAYPAAQLVLALTVILLALSDLRYHLQNIKWWLLALPLIVVALLPYARFALQHPDESWYHLRSVNSYVVDDIPLTEKITGFISRYAQGISPLYWFFPNEVDLMRHRMKDYGHLPLVALPLLLIGFAVCVARFRDSKYRLLLIALISAPFGAALVDVLILRLLAFVVPATLLTVVGLEWLINRFAKKLSPQLVGAVLFVPLAFGGLWMTRDALVNGPTWFETYDLYGMQWGAKQLFDVLKEVRATAPKSPIVMTSSWANGTEEFVNFFMPDEKNLSTKTINTWIEDELPLSRNTIFVMTPGELNEASESGKFKEPEYVWRLKYPNGARAFEIVRMEYVDNISEIFQQERDERAKPVTDIVSINGQDVTVIHSQFDSGSPKDMFDNDAYTLARGRDANPLRVEFVYPTPRPITSLFASFGQMRFRIKVSLYAPGSDTPVVFEQTSNSDAPIPEITMQFDGAPAQVRRADVEIEHLGSPGEAKIHVRELRLQ